MISWLGRPERPFSRKKINPRLTTALLARIALVILLIAWWQAASWYERQLIAEKRTEAALEVSLRGNVLSSILNRRFARLQGLYAFAQADPDREILAETFEDFASALYLDSTGIRNMAIAPGGVMQNVYPIIGNESVIGYAPLDDPRPQIRADTLLAIETGEIIISGPVDLVQGGSGIILRQAVYNEDGNFWGLVNLVIDFQTLLQEAGVNAQDGNLIFALRDEQGQVLSGSADIFNSDPVLNTIELPEGVWELGAVPPDGWQSTIREQQQLFMFSGLLIVFLLAVLVYMLFNRQTRLALAVQSRTAELSHLNKQLVQSHQLLEQRVQERTHALSSLLEISYNLAENLELQPLLQVLLDQLDVFIGYDGAVVCLLEQGEMETAAGRGQRPLIMEGLAVGEVDQILRNHWEKTGWIGPIRSNFNNPFHSQEETIADEAAPSWIAIPLKLYDQFLGMVVLSQNDPDYYTARHEQLMMVVANQAAITIENARLYQQARNLAVLKERQRLARELHDSVSQALYGIVLGAKTARAQLSKEPAKAAEPLDYVLSLSDAALTEMRALIFELRPESLENEGLLAALERQAQVLRARFKIDVDTHWDEEPPLSLPMKEVLYRVTQEATNNTAKHAAAKHVSIELHQDDGQVMVEIRDDGQGFDMNQTFPGHLGLHSMRERIEQVGGSFEIESQIGQGTCVKAAVPLG
jgi:signal transduction histidine kinase/sensor domain CHASE-containing protein